MANPVERAVWLGVIGVAMFSLTLPATRLAVLELPADFVAFGRLALAGLAAIPVLALLGARRPRRAEAGLLILVLLGVVLGFPILTTLALRHVDASHGAVVLAVLPLLTGAAGALLAGERPSARFWLWACLGTACVLAFALARGQGRPTPADLVLLLACALAAMGYAAGARLGRAMPGLAVIAWALVLALPLALPLAWMARPAEPGAVDAAAWAAFVYVALGSQLTGFYFWYRALALGGIARIGQVQLLQTFMTLGFSALILGERLDPGTLAAATLTVACVWAGRRSATPGLRQAPTRSDTRGDARPADQAARHDSGAP